MKLFIVGLLLCLGGVGAVEQSLTTLAMLQGFVVALVGCVLMQAGVFVMQGEVQ